MTIRDFAILILVISSPRILACSCFEYEGALEDEVVEAFRHADAVVFAKSTNVSTDGDNYQVTGFEVIKSWKGAIEGSFTTGIQFGCCNCSVFFHPDYSYLLYLYGPDESGHYETHACVRSNVYLTETSAEIDVETAILDNIESEQSRYDQNKRAESNSMPVFFDSGIAGIVDVTDSPSELEKQFSKLSPCEQYKDWSRTYCFSDKDKEYLLKISIDKSDDTFLVDELSISTKENSDKRMDGKSVYNFGSHFQTIAGVTMQMTLDTLTAKFGEPDKTSIYEEGKYLYSVEDNAVLFKNHGIADYSAYYTFESGELVELTYLYFPWFDED